MMKVVVRKTPQELGTAAAQLCAQVIGEAIREKGKARVVFSTGASQFELFDALLKSDIDWTRVEMFHLDEYVALPESHPASFRKYLKSRFIDKVQLKQVTLVNGEAELSGELKRLGEALTAEPIDLGLIGIGENAHIAFNDPPADFDTTEPYIVVNLSDTCKAQQVHEGWFPTENDVPRQAISMSVHQIMQCRTILSFVPYAVKANAIKKTLESACVTNEIPATKLREHSCVWIYADQDSSAAVEPETLSRYLDEK